MPGTHNRQETKTNFLKTRHVKRENTCEEGEHHGPLNKIARGNLCSCSPLVTPEVNVMPEHSTSCMNELMKWTVS